MTKTQEAKVVMDQEWLRIRAEYRAVIVAEFKPGTRVKYQHGMKWIVGAVTEVAPWEWSTKVTLKNEKTGTTWEREAHELEFA